MTSASKLTIGFLALSLFAATGCVGPHGPLGCTSCGPVSVGGSSSCDSCTGCGELYVDPWINHPADCVDPCDTCGNFNGQSCGKCRPLFAGIGSLWGFRHPDCGGCDSCAVPVGCASCGIESCDGCCETSCGIESCPGCAACGGSAIHGDGGIISEPTYTDEVIEIAPAESHQHTPARKIFRQRESVAGRAGVRQH